MKYLFKHWGAVKEKLSGEFIMLFLDYDGTLTPIAETPEKAAIPDEMKKVLKKLSINTNCKLAIISGRALKDVKKRAGIEGIIYAGNHGLEIEGPEIKFQSPVPVRYKAIFKQIKDDLTARLSPIKGVILENKGMSLSVHYRLVDKGQIPRVKDIADETVVPYLVRNKIKVKPGKMVLEIRPPIEWDKGKVVLWLLARQKFTLKGRNCAPIYIGDDVTDEDAFKALDKKGLTIFVGAPKSSRAKYYLKDTGEVFEFLKKILILIDAGNIC